MSIVGSGDGGVVVFGNRSVVASGDRSLKEELDVIYAHAKSACIIAWNHRVLVTCIIGSTRATAVGLGGHTGWGGSGDRLGVKGNGTDTLRRHSVLELCGVTSMRLSRPVAALRVNVATRIITVTTVAETLKGLNVVLTVIGRRGGTTKSSRSVTELRGGVNNRGLDMSVDIIAVA